MIRALTLADLAAGERLCQQAGWNQVRGDWRRLADWEPEGCLVAERQGAVVGTVSTTTYGPRLAWLGMLLVDAAWRGQGLGRALLAAAVRWLDARPVDTVGLDAAPHASGLYERLGFVEHHRLHRWHGLASAVAALPGVRLFAADDLRRVAPVDAAALGVARGRVLEALWRSHPSGCFVYQRDGLVLGYALSRPGARRWYVGPVVAADARAARAVLHATLAPLAGQPVAVDAPDVNAAAAVLLHELGLAPGRPFVRMVRGAAAPPSDPGYSYGIAGPELG